MSSLQDVLDLEKEILRLVDRKRRVDHQLNEIETKIHTLETDYLAETRTYGNIFYGLDGYLGQQQINRSTIDRPFSLHTSEVASVSPKRLARIRRQK